MPPDLGTARHDTHLLATIAATMDPTDEPTKTRGKHPAPESALATPT